MATFSQWFKKAQKGYTPPQITWLCGDQHVLHMEVLDYIQEALGDIPDRATYFAGVDSDRDIWESILQRPLMGEKKLIVIRDASKLGKLERLVDVATARTREKNTYLVFIDSGNAPLRLEPTEEELKRRKKPKLIPALEAISKRGDIVECNAFTQGTAETAVLWVQSQLKIRSGSAAHLLERANGDLRVVRDACKILTEYDGEITPKVVNLLFDQNPRDDFITALMLRDKETAFRSLKSVKPSEYSQLLIDLDTRVSVAETIHVLQTTYHTPAEIQRQLGGHRIFYDDLVPVAKHYTSKATLRLRQLLAELDSVQRQHYTRATMEALVAMW